MFASVGSSGIGEQSDQNKTALEHRIILEYRLSVLEVVPAGKTAPAEGKR